MNVLYIGILVILFILIVGLGYVVWGLQAKLKKMLQLADESDAVALQELYKKYIDKLEASNKRIKDLESRLDDANKEAEDFISDIRLVRFNPFKETGGDQSFIISLLNKRKTGVMITGLYSRASSRVYAKTIKNGEGEGVLSEEEKQLLAK